MGSERRRVSPPSPRRAAVRRGGAPRARLPLSPILALAVLLVGCNAVLGGGAVVVMGTAGYFASQCYDHLLVRVRDQRTGVPICDAEVWVSDGDSDRRMRPCYHAALGPGRWTVELREPGFDRNASTVIVTEPEGACPHATHTVELMLAPEGRARPSRLTAERR